MLKQESTNLLAIRILNSGVVLLDEMILDELDGECGFTNATIADHHQLILGHRPSNIFLYPLMCSQAA